MAVHTKKRILFASPHCLVDFASGAAVATRDALELLAQRGFECRAFCASKLDGDGQWSEFRGQGSEVRRQQFAVGNDLTVELTHLRLGAVPVTVFPTLSAQIDDWAPDEPQAMRAAFDGLLGDFRPDVVMTYGGHPAAQDMMRLAKRRRIPVVFWLHNFAYNDGAFFRDVDHVIVPSEFSRRWYERRLGLKCHVLPYAIDWGRVSCQSSVVSAQGETPHPSPLPARGAREVDSGSQPSTLNPQRFVTFVNPQPLGQWIFWMDTDDVIDAENARKIRELVLSLRTSADSAVVSSGPTDSTAENAEQRGGLPVLGYLMKVRCPSVGENGDAGYVEVDQVKLFRNLPGIRFEGRIHEQVLMPIRRAGGTAAWTDIFVVHANADLSPERRAKKTELDLRILQLDHAERPDHPFVLFNLGMAEKKGTGVFCAQHPSGRSGKRLPSPFSTVVER